MSRRGGDSGRRSAWLALGLCSFACGLAWAGPAADASALRGLLVAGGFSAAQTQAALAALERAEARGLPASVLENRMREGLARHAEPAAILGVLADRLSDLEKAQALSRRCSEAGIAVRDRERSLTRLADSLSMGVTPGDVTSVLPDAVRGKRDLEAVSRAAEVMGRLDRQGFPAQETRDVMGAALAAGWTREQMDALAGAFVEGRRLGLSHDTVHQALVNGVRSGKASNLLVEDLRGRAKAAVEPSSAVPPRSEGSADAASSKAAKQGGASAQHGAGARNAPPRTPTPRGAQPHAPRPRSAPAHPPGPKMMPRPHH